MGHVSYPTENIQMIALNTEIIKILNLLKMTKELSVSKKT